jgi:hypothetical protein
MGCVPALNKYCGWSLPVVKPPNDECWMADAYAINDYEKLGFGRTSNNSTIAVSPWRITISKSGRHAPCVKYVGYISIVVSHALYVENCYVPITKKYWVDVSCVSDTTYMRCLV